MDTPPATIFVVDDDADVRKALARLLRSAGYEVRTFASGAEFLAGHDRHLPGCVILDLAIPGFGGLEVQSYLTATGCRRPIIFLTANGSIGTTVRALKAGAVNFLMKPVEQNELFAAVEEALRVDAAERSRESFQKVVAQRLATLTPRERQVLEHVVAGRLNKQIAADLGTVEKTVKVHRARAMHKMGARSLAELVHLAASLGIPTGPPPRRSSPEVSALRPAQRPATAPVDR